MAFMLMYPQLAGLYDLMTSLLEGMSLVVFFTHSSCTLHKLVRFVLPWQ